MLHPGLYEQVINQQLTSELQEIPEARKSVAPIDKAEASKVLAQYLAEVVQKGMDNLLDNGGDIAAQVQLTNKIVELVQTTTQENAFADMDVNERVEQLLALLQAEDPRLAVGKTAANRRADLIVGALLKYVTDIDEVKGLGFCVSVEHAKFMSDYFNAHNIPAMYLVGDSPDEERSAAKQRLVSGKIRFIFVVDIYNEGVDIPEVNTVLFLRPTESLTKAFARLSVVDSRRWITFLLKLLPQLDDVDFASLPQLEQRMLQMFYVAI